MSDWTNVVGNLRIDGIPSMGMTKEKIVNLFGPMCLFEKWDDSSKLPRGSEGSLQYQIIEYDDGLPWLTVPIWGDLRDYTDFDEITKWWEDIIATILKEGLGMIRDGVLNMESSAYTDRRTLVYEYKETD